MRVKPTYSIREYGYLLEEPTNNARSELEAQSAVVIPRSAFRYLLSFIKNDDEKDA